MNAMQRAAIRENAAVHFAWGSDDKRHGMKQIAVEVSSKTGVPLSDIFGPRRFPEIVLARHEAMWRARRETGASLPKIGRFFGRDHTSVLHAIRRVEERLHREITE